MKKKLLLLTYISLTCFWPLCAQTGLRPAIAEMEIRIEPDFNRLELHLILAIRR